MLVEGNFGGNQLEWLCGEDCYTAAYPHTVRLYLNPRMSEEATALCDGHIHLVCEQVRE